MGYEYRNKGRNSLNNPKTRKLRKIIVLASCRSIKKWELSQCLRGKSSTIISLESNGNGPFIVLVLPWIGAQPGQLIKYSCYSTGNFILPLLTKCH